MVPHSDLAFERCLPFLICVVALVGRKAAPTDSEPARPAKASIVVQREPPYSTFRTTGQRALERSEQRIAWEFGLCRRGPRKTPDSTRCSRGSARLGTERLGGLR